MQSSIARLWDTLVALDAALRCDDQEAGVVAAGATVTTAVVGATLTTAVGVLAAVLEEPLTAVSYRPRPADRPVWQSTVHIDAREPASTDTGFRHPGLRRPRRHSP